MKSIDISQYQLNEFKLLNTQIYDGSCLFCLQYLRKDDWHFWVAMKNGQVIDWHFWVAMKNGQVIDWHFWVAMKNGQVIDWHFWMAMKNGQVIDWHFQVAMKNGEVIDGCQVLSSISAVLFLTLQLGLYLWVFLTCFVILYI